MKLSENWLRQRVNPDVDTDTLIAQLTMAGLEVEGVEPAAPALDNVVIGEIVSLQKHPDADKLNLCQVSDGSETYSVICGAGNVRQNMKVAYARIGAKLPGIKIKKAKIRGVESFGMLCSASELGLAESSEGIMDLPQDLELGMSFIDALSLNDNIIEIDLTPNRGDCLSIEGVAREISALNSTPLSQNELLPVNNAIDDEFPVKIEATEYCPRYVGRIVKGIDPAAETPLWMKEKLRRCGLRPISPVVDITNFVMMETGQPMHGFDFDKLEGGIVVRLAKKGEKLVLLDQSEVECRDDTLVIADQKKALALAGIMGGLSSSVQSETSNIYFEAAFFAPVKIAGKARSYGMHTDSSHRFERGVNAQGQQQAIQRATQLLLEIAGGQAGPINNCAHDASLPATPEITLRYARVKRLLGIDISETEIETMLTALNIDLQKTTDGWICKPPSYRFDINIEADLIEEVGRMVGYDNIEGTKEQAHAEMQSFSETTVALSSIKEVLVEQGYNEAVTYTFISPELQEIFDPEQNTLALANPISSDMSTMRTRLIPGLFQAMDHNVKRQQSRVKLFESGLCFRPVNDSLEQKQYLAGLITGMREAEGVYSANEKVDFFDIKGDFEKLIEHGNKECFRYVRSENPILHPGQSADVYYDSRNIGFIGALHPSVLAQAGFKQSVFVFEVELDAIMASRLPKFAELSRFPSIRRDISVNVDQDISAEALINCVKSVKNKILQEVFVFDVYTGNEVRNSLKSVALGLILQDFSRTLVDEDVEKLVEKILSQLKEQHNAILREN